MICSKDYIKQAGQVADQVILVDYGNRYSTISWSSKDIEILDELVRKAIQLEPADPYHLYSLQHLKIAQGLGKTGHLGIKTINESYPEFVEAIGFLNNPEKWFSPFYYPSWNRETIQPDRSLSMLPSNGTMVISMREYVKRTVCFFRNTNANEIPKHLKKAKCDIDFKLIETPYGPVAGLYTLISPQKGEPLFSETLLNLDSSPEEIRDISVCGCWLLRLLAEQPYTYIILNDPVNGVAYNTQFYFKSHHKKKLSDIAQFAKNVTQLDSLDKQRMDNARTYYMNNVSVKNLF